MAPRFCSAFLPFVSLIFIISISGVLSSNFTITNNCAHTIWPGIFSSAGRSQLETTGFVLQKGESKSLSVPASWAGRLWGRSACTQDSTGKFSCITGDCGSGKVECVGGDAAHLATLAEFALTGVTGLDFFDVSLVDGYNLPMLVFPHGGAGGNCSAIGCVVELNGVCPTELKVASADGNDVACKSACDAFGDPQY